MGYVFMGSDINFLQRATQRKFMSFASLPNSFSFPCHQVSTFFGRCLNCSSMVAERGPLLHALRVIGNESVVTQDLGFAALLPRAGVSQDALVVVHYR